jgi:hypothetical protein
LQRRSSNQKSLLIEENEREAVAIKNNQRGYRLKKSVTEREAQIC